MVVNVSVVEVLDTESVVAASSVVSICIQRIWHCSSISLKLEYYRYANFLFSLLLSLPRIPISTSNSTSVYDPKSNTSLFPCSLQ